MAAARAGAVLGTSTLLLALSWPASAVQTVTPVQNAAGTTFTANGPNSWAVTRGPGQTLVFFGRYSSDQVNESGLGLAVQYDETKLTNVTVDQVVNRCLIASPQLLNIAAGNSLALFGWADISIRRTAGVPNGALGWTGTADPAAPTKSAAPTDGCLDIATFGLAGPQTTAALTPPLNLFRFTATVAPGFNSGQTTISLSAPSASSASCVPTQVAPCFVSQSLVVTGTSAPPLVLQSVVSRKTHSAAGPFDLVLNPAPTTPSTEPRSGGAGGNALLVFVFDGAVTGGVASVTEGTATAGSPTFSGNEVAVPLSGVANEKYVTVSLTGLVAAGGGPTSAASIRLGFLLGDVSQNRVVTLADLLSVNNVLAQTVGPTNFLRDVNLSGTLSLADKLTVNANLTKALPSP